MRFKNFEARPTHPEKDSDGNLQYEVVKWHETKSYCWVIGFLTRRGPDNWEFRSVGMRYFRDREDGLEDYIVTYCHLVDACLDDDED